MSDQEGILGGHVTEVEWLEIEAAPPGRGVNFDASPEKIRQYRVANVHMPEVANMTDEQIVMQLGREAFSNAYGEESG